MDQDVIVAGAGPVGLMLACELALQGVSVVVLERLTEQDLTIKAGAMTLPACEALNRRGFSGELAELQRQTFKRFGHWPPREPEAGDKPKPPMLAHFGGMFKIDVSRLDPEDELLQLNPAAITPMVSQQELERVLTVRAEKLGVEIRRGVELTGFVQDDDGVTAELADGGRARGAYLVGCDGGRSTIRKLAGFDFPGTDPTITGYQAIVDLDAPEKLTKGWTRTPGGTLVSGPVPGRVLTVEYDGPPADRAAPVTKEDVQASLRRVSGTDVTIEKVHTATRFSDNARQVTTYRQGRVLLAGDAAHVHSPFGGQGLNLGIGDAVNLGWKLAATVQGWAADGLLDTYTAERHPIGAAVLDATRAQVASLRPDPLSGALRKIISDLMDTDEGNDYFARLMLGFGQRYDLGDGDRIAGARMPDYELADGSWMGDRFASGKAVLFDFTGSAAVAAAAAGRESRITLVSLPAKGNIELKALLVRPDGYVAWASRAPGETAGLAEAIGRWFGEAR